MKSVDALLLLLRAALGTRVPSDELRDVQWDEVYRLAAEQGVVGIAADGLQRICDSSLEFRDESLEKSNSLLSEDLYYSWLGQVMMQEETFKEQCATMGKLLSLWNGNGLEVVALKGLAFAQYYPVPEHRQCCDFDCYFRFAEGRQTGGYEAWEWADKLVAEQGIEVNDTESKHSRYVVDGLSVENHRNVIGVNGSKKRKEFDKYLVDLFSHCDKFRDFSPTLLSPPWLFNALFCLAHAQVHFLEETGITLKYILDWCVIRRYQMATAGLDGFKEFHEVVDQFGLRKFYEAVDELADYIEGKAKLTDSGRMLLDDILAQKEVRQCKTKFLARWNILRMIWENRWKYKYYADTTMSATMWRYVYGHFFDRN